MVALSVQDIFTLIFVLIFVIVIIYAVCRRFCVTTKDRKKGRKSSSSGGGVGSQATDRPQSSVSSSPQSSSSSSSPNSHTIYLDSSHQVGNLNGSSVYTIPISSLDLTRASVVIVRNGNGSAPITLRIPQPIVEEPPPSYEDCLPPPAYSPPKPTDPANIV